MTYAPGCNDLESTCGDIRSPIHTSPQQSCSEPTVSIWSSTSAPTRVNTRAQSAGTVTPRASSRSNLSGPPTNLEEVARQDVRWSTRKCALGAEQAEVTINVAGNGEESSSILPMLERHRESAPEASYVGVKTVHQERLDDLMAAGLMPVDTQRMYLKIDVQGYEKSVLTGASDLLRSPRLVGLQMELSFVPLYEGEMTWREGLNLVTDQGFVIKAIQPGFTDPATQQMLQADVLAFRD